MKKLMIEITEEDVANAKAEYLATNNCSTCCPTNQALRRYLIDGLDLSVGFNTFMSRKPDRAIGTIVDDNLKAQIGQWGTGLGAHKSDPLSFAPNTYEVAVDEQYLKE